MIPVVEQVLDLVKMIACAIKARRERKRKRRETLRRMGLDKQ